MGNSIYRGVRNKDGVRVTVNGRPLRHIEYHSDDFEWGYGGSGPADLALALLAHHLGENWVNEKYLKRLKITQDAPLCWTFHQDFKCAIVASLNRKEWELTSSEISGWLSKQRKGERV